MKSSDITVTDQFCGAGGSTTGAKLAGARVKLALNHWKLAVETHNTNHPEVDHDCTDIQACDPRRYPSTTILITSPECTNHSLAKGQKRKNKAQMDLFGTVTTSEEEERSRATMWDVPRFAEYHGYEAIIVENVVDARYWVMWDAWLMAMHSLGYLHRAVYMNSMFAHPTPQSRDRMYVVFWKRGNPAPDLEFRPPAHCLKCGCTRETFQSWKNPAKKWGKYRQQYIYRCSACNTEVTPWYYAAWNAIDWSIPGEKIGDRKTPLSPRTIERIRAGLAKYGRQPITVTTGYSSGIDCRVSPAIGKPLATQPGRPQHNILIPFVVKSAYGGGTKEATEVLYTQTTEQTVGLCVPMLIENYGMSKGGRLVTDRMGAITAGGVNHGLLVGNYTPGWARSTSEPSGTITTTDHHGLVTGESLAAFLQYYYGTGNQTTHVAEAIATVTTTDRASLIQPAAEIEQCYYRMLRPHEIQAAMAFPHDYQVLGNGRQKVKQLGNAVTPPAMEWLVNRVVQSLTK